MDAPTLAMLKVLTRAEDTVWLSLEAACQAYAGSATRRKPLVDGHFTPGNNQRGGWPPLSRAYEEQKARGVVVHRGAGFHLTSKERKALGVLKRADAAAKKGAGRKARALMPGAKPKSMAADFLDTFVASRPGSRAIPVKGSSGMTDRTVFGGSTRSSATTLPMLVRSGELRMAVTSGKVAIRIDKASGIAWIIFRGQPKHRSYHHTGTPRMPKRSPYEPFASDIKQMRAIAQQFYDDAIGKRRGNPMRGARKPR